MIGARTFNTLPRKGGRTAAAAIDALTFNPGDRVRLVGKHPHAGTSGTLVSYGPYGPADFGWKGWLVNLENSPVGTDACYAKLSDIKKERRS